MRTPRTQTGYIYPRGGWWVLRYGENVINENGQGIRKQMAKQLAPIAPEHARLKRPPDEIVKMGERFLRPLNDGTTSPESSQTLRAFAEEWFFPQKKARVRQSTYQSYLSRWESQLKPHCGEVRLRDFRVADAQRLMDSIHRQNPGMKRSTLAHLKLVLGLIFWEAERVEILPKGSNPIPFVLLPEDAPEDNETYAYSLGEIQSMLAALPEPAATICAVAAFTGLRRAELRGLRWEDYTGNQIMVNRSVWESFTNKPKTKRSKAPVEVIGPLVGILARHRLRCGNPQSGWMFANSRAKPVNLNNTLNREILPALNRCAICGKDKPAHIAAAVEHEFERDGKLPEWHGWHAFRRGLGTTLYALGVDDLMVQRIMRHKDVEVTREHYIKTTSRQSAPALAKFGDAYTELCADRAPEVLPAKRPAVN